MKKVNKGTVVELVLLGISAVSMMAATFIGTRNAVHDEIDDIRKRGEERKEEERS